MKKVLYFFGGILLVLFLMIFRPVQIPSDEKDLNSISGTVEYIFEGGTKDATFRLTEYQGKMFYINRGLENGLNLEDLKVNLIGKKVTLKYPSHWTPLDPMNTIKHVSILEHDGEVLYSELD